MTDQTGGRLPEALSEIPDEKLGIMIDNANQLSRAAAYRAGVLSQERKRRYNKAKAEAALAAMSLGELAATREALNALTADA